MRLYSRHFHTGDFHCDSWGTEKTQQRSCTFSVCLERLYHTRTKA
uniref:Uncharacterized protein n=1 Tax=Anguilla anguilla TaxID=7936 RepID=A0A0E9VLP2_ANGAN